MPRRGRLYIPEGCYHVIGRGLERRYLFEDSADKRDFLSRLGQNLRRSGAQCLAWALMFNHYHFLILLGVQPLGKLMAPALGGFAGNYNRRHHRSGYVFQNRFTSILCDEGSYLLELVRYIHLNPMRAKMIESVSDLGKYPWTGHAGMIVRCRQNWHAVEEVLPHFDQGPSIARRKYLEFIEAGAANSDGASLSGGGLVRSYGSWESVGQLRKEQIVCIGDERILGESEFVTRVLKEDEFRLESKSKISRDGWTIDKLVIWVCAHYEVEQSALYVRSRDNSVSKAKAVICYLAAEKLGISTTEIAAQLGISRQAASKWIPKGRKESETEACLEAFKVTEGFVGALGNYGCTANI